MLYRVRNSGDIIYLKDMAPPRIELGPHPRQRYGPTQNRTADPSTSKRYFATRLLGHQK